MLEITLKQPEDPPPLEKEQVDFQFFLQRMVNRRYVGKLRYGRIESKQKYLTKLKKELHAYEQTGNAEQLLNIAVYAYLEWYAPENKKYHFDNTVDSVARGE
jgi:hypothetical protein